MEEKKLFYVEFGEPRPSGFMQFSFGNPGLSPVYVVAKDYNEAVNKAMVYAEFKKEFNKKGSILDENGSLRNTVKNDDEEIKIRSIAVISDDVIW
jgi:hypothetical protein